MSVKINTISLVLVLMFFPVLCIAKNGGNLVIINGKLKLTSKGDSFTVITYQYGMEELVKKYVVPVNKGSFKVTISQVKEPLYIRIIFPPKYSSSGEKYLVESGDIIQLSELNNKIIYSGHGSFKFNCRDSLTNIYNDQYLNKWKNNENTPSKSVYQSFDSIGSFQLRYLLKCRKQLSLIVYILFKIDILSGIELKKDYCLLYSNFRRDSMINSSIKQSLTDYYNSSWIDLLKTVKAHPRAIGYSVTLYQSISSRYNIDSFIYTGKPFNLKRYFDYTVKNYSGLLLEKLITKGVYMRKSRDPALGLIIPQISKYIKNEDFQSFISKINSNNSAGVKAYNFSLSDVDGKFHKLTDYSNKIVIIDFWFTGCTNCIDVNTKLQRIEELFTSDSNLVFISISIDTNREQWLRSIKGGKYTTENRVNLFTNGQGSTYPMISYYSIDGYPRILVIDRNGKLCEATLDPRLDEGQSLIAIIEKQLKNSGTATK